MNTASQTETSPTAQRLAAEYKARQARFAAAARKVSRRGHVLHAPVLTAEEVDTGKIVELWHVRPFDEHVKAFEPIRKQFEKTAGHRLKRYILMRAIQLGLDFDKVMRKTQKKAVVAIRDQIIWEIKTIVKPDISYPELGRLFAGRDHTSVLAAYRRAAGKAGETETAEMYLRKKQAMNDRYRETKARAT